MNQILARVKGKRKKQHFKLISDETLFEDIAVDLNSCAAYNADHNLDEDSWFKIDQFSQQTFCIELLKKDFDSKDFDDLTKAQFVQITYLFSVQGKDFYFQKITPSLFVKKKTISFGEAVEIEKSRNRLVVNETPDAIYIKASDTLVFRNLATISSIFKGIDILYREATQKETEDFLKEPFIDLKNNYDASTVSKPNRKRIALAVDSLAKMSPQEKINILAYIDGYCDQKLNFNKKKQKFEISTDDALKLLLYGIEQRFYTTPFGQEKRLANSVQALD